MRLLVILIDVHKVLEQRRRGSADSVGSVAVMALGRVRHRPLFERRRLLSGEERQLAWQKVHLLVVVKR